MRNPMHFGGFSYVFTKKSCIGLLKFNLNSVLTIPRFSFAVNHPLSPGPGFVYTPKHRPFRWFSPAKALSPAHTGPLAQLVERLICNEEATGPNPVRSTIVKLNTEDRTGFGRGVGSGGAGCPSRVGRSWKPRVSMERSLAERRPTPYGPLDSPFDSAQGSLVASHILNVQGALYFSRESSALSESSSRMGKFKTEGIRGTEPCEATSDSARSTKYERVAVIAATLNLSLFQGRLRPVLDDEIVQASRRHQQKTMACRTGRVRNIKTKRGERFGDPLNEGYHREWNRFPAIALTVIKLAIAFRDVSHQCRFQILLTKRNPRARYAPRRSHSRHTSPNSRCQW